MSSLNKVLYRAASFFTLSSLVYTLCVALAKGQNQNINDVYMLLFKNQVALFVFSVIFGLSFLFFNIKKLPPAAKRFFHIVLLYLAMLGTIFIMADVSGEPRDIILFIFMATLLFMIIYLSAMGLSSLIKKKFKKGN